MAAYDGAQRVGLQHPSTGGLLSATVQRIKSAASTNAQVIKASPTALLFINALNTAAAARYLKIYDKASAPTLASDLPILTLLLPATNSQTQLVLTDFGIALANGLAIAIVTNLVDTDATAIAANDVYLTIGYA